MRIILIDLSLPSDSKHLLMHPPPNSHDFDQFVPEYRYKSLSGTAWPIVLPAQLALVSARESTDRARAGNAGLHSEAHPAIEHIPHRAHPHEALLPRAKKHIVLVGITFRVRSECRRLGIKRCQAARFILIDEPGPVVNSAGPGRRTHHVLRHHADVPCQGWRLERKVFQRMGTG